MCFEVDPVRRVLECENERDDVLVLEPSPSTFARHLLVHHFRWSWLIERLSYDIGNGRLKHRTEMGRNKDWRFDQPDCKIDVKSIWMRRYR